MKKVYLHVGMPKTGTTFLQTRCFPYLKGIRYGDKALIELLERIIYLNPIMLDLQRTAQEAQSALGQVAEDSILLSYERLFGNMLRNYEDQVYLTGCLKAIFPEAKLLIVIRRQDELVESIYKQSLQSGYYQTINSFLNYRHQTFGESGDRLSLPNLDIKQFDLHRYVQHYVANFGRDHVAVLPYELLKHDRRDFLTQLAAAVNVEPFYPAHDRQENRSYSWAACQIALLLNRFVRVEGDGSRLLQVIPNKPLTSFLQGKPAERRVYRVLRGLNSRLTLRYVLQNGLDRLIYVRGNLLSRKKRESIMAFHRESNMRLDQEFNLNLKLFGYY
jgi:hypothetical protein